MDSDFATENEISDGRIFFSLDPDGLYFDGSQNDILLLTTCLDPLQQINFLLTYKSSFEDSWKCQFTSFGVPTTNEGVVQGFLYGFGTLILPSGIN